ncbi:MAG: hypothetical protein WDN72_02670 [Alphaproteobacteria bacterium]
MALLGKFGDDYTKTGKNWFSRASDWLSYIPWVGGAFALPIGIIGAGVDAAGWLFRGKFLSALTAFAGGAAASAVNSAASTVGGSNFALWWLGNAGSGLLSGETLGTHARALTEGAIGTVTGALGVKPTVLRSYTAGIGSIGGAGATTESRATGHRAGRRSSAAIRRKCITRTVAATAPTMWRRWKRHARRAAWPGGTCNESIKKEWGMLWQA